MANAKLNIHEKQIIAGYDNGEYVAIPNADKEKQRYALYAKSLQKKESKNTITRQKHTSMPSLIES